MKKSMSIQQRKKERQKKEKKRLHNHQEGNDRRCSSLVRTSRVTGRL